MKTLHVELGDRSYEIVIDSGCLARAGEAIRSVCPRAKKLFVVTDSHVGPIYDDRLRASAEAAGFQVFRRVVPAGESTKCVEELSALWEAMLEAGLTRTDAVVALGGGVVGDLAGFAAATILRGVSLIQIPTTLLSQVDSSVGGKVGIDLRAGKNLAGAFWQPRLVLMDPEVLDTLDDAAFSDGMAEVIKYGCIWDREFFELLTAQASRQAIMGHIEEVLYTCCDVKRQVVEADERDTGLRMLLNFGHTMGHAYELAGNYEIWTHGQAVAAGMVCAARLGTALGVTPPGTAEDIGALLSCFGLPLNIPCDTETYTAAIGHDKKGAGSDIDFILLERLGRAVARKMPKAQLVQLLHSVDQTT